MLVCFAQNCYHSVTAYTWYHDNKELVGNQNPLLYTMNCAEYKCVLKGAKGVIKSQRFLVIGMLLLITAYNYYIHNYNAGVEDGKLMDVVVSSQHFSSSSSPPSKG